jgi:hypothetical protein
MRKQTLIALSAGMLAIAPFRSQAQTIAREPDVRIASSPVNEGLNLSESQLAAVKSLNMKYVAEVERLRSRLSTPGSLRSSLHALMARHETELRQILSPGQNAKLDDNLRKYRKP